MTIQLLRAADRTPAPWKNGGGLTREIAVAPPGAGLDAFDWRVSLAEVSAAGPFSVFPGVDRLWLVLEGALTLDVVGAESVDLDGTSATVEIPGDAPVSVQRPSAPALSVNIMHRRDRFTASLERRRVSGTGAAVCQDVTLIFCRAPCLEAALGAERFELSLNDALRIDGQRGVLARLKIRGGGEIILAHINVAR